MKSESERDRILVVRFSSLGDILLTAPAIRALRTRFGDAEICLLVADEFADAASLIPGLDAILTFDRRSGLRGLLRLRKQLSRRFSIFVDLQNNLRSLFLRSLTFPTIWVKAKRFRLKRWLFVTFKWNLYGEVIPVPLRYLYSIMAIGAQDDGRGLELRLPGSARLAIESSLHAMYGRTVVALCPGARHFTKRWPKERWMQLCERLARRGLGVVVIGSEDESELVDEIASCDPESVKMVGRSIPEVAAVMKSCAAVVSNDSGLMHLAAGVETPVLGIFGPTVKEFGFFPFRATSRVIEQNLSCRPCSAMGSQSCKERHFRCMLDTTDEMVEAEVNELLKPRHQAS